MNYLYDLTPEEQDALTRTVIGEAGNQSDIGKQAVAAVALNRLAAKKYGSTLADVLFAKNQFEPWQRSPGKLLSYSPDSPEYKAAADAVDAARMGFDPTNGATHFYAPAAQAAMGRAAPQWAQGQGLRIGDHVFYAPGGPVARKQVAQASAQAPAGDMPDIDALYSQFATGGGKSAAPAPAAQASPASGPEPDIDGLYSQFAVKPEDMPKPAAPAPATVAPVAQGPLTTVPEDGSLSTMAANKARQLGTGFVRGVADATNPAAMAKGGASAIINDAQAIATGRPYADVAAENEARAANPGPTQGPGWYQRLVETLHNLHNTIAPENVLPDVPKMQNRLLGVTGEAVPQSMADRVLQAGGEAVGASLGPGVRGSSTGAATPNMLSTVAGQAPMVAASGAAGEYGAEKSGHPLVGMAASMAPAAVVGAGRAAVNKLAGTVDPNTAALADAARNKYDMPITADQMSGSPAMKFFGDVLRKLPLSGAGDNAAEVQTGFNRAVASTFGEDASKVTPKVMAAARDRIGAQFEKVANSTTIKPDTKLVQDMHDILTKASEVLEPNELGLLQKQVGKFWDAMKNNGHITGEQYQAWTDTRSPLSKLMNSDSRIADFADDLKGAVDDALERHAPPDMVDTLRTAKYQWKNMRTVENLVAKAPDGDISPSLLQGRVNANNKGTYGAAYGGGGDLKELADIGQRFVKPPPSSGTSERSLMMYLLGAGTTAGANLLAGNVPGAIATGGGTAALLGGGRALGSALRSNWLANDVIANSLGRPPVPGLANKLIQLGSPAVLTNNRLPVAQP